MEGCAEGCWNQRRPPAARQTRRLQGALGLAEDTSDAAVACRQSGPFAFKGKIAAHSYFSWAGERFNGGDVSFFGPGQVRWVDEMAKPAGRVHFCGEHTAIASRGLEGALESAERVAVEVVTA